MVDGKYFVTVDQEEIAKKLGSVQLESDTPSSDSPNVKKREK